MCSQVSTTVLVVFLNKKSKSNKHSQEQQNYLFYRNVTHAFKNIKSK